MLKEFYYKNIFPYISSPQPLFTRARLDHVKNMQTALELLYLWKFVSEFSLFAKRLVHAQSDQI